MAQPFSIALAPGLILKGGDQIIIHAVDPTDGGQIPGVQMSNATLEVDQLGGGSLASGAFVPLLRKL